MTMYSQQYANPIRIVSGTVNVNNDDLVLGCNTSLGAVTLNLGAIPANKWNTIWKLLVSDSSNNASVNNITINAGSGQTINGASSLVISTNGAGCIISILNNTAFIATLTAGGGGGGGVSSVGATSPITSSGGANPNISTSMATNKLIGRSTAGTGAMEEITLGTNLNIGSGTLNAQAYSVVQDEGSPLTQRTTIDFVGTGVAVTDNGSKTIVTINNAAPYLYSPKLLQSPVTYFPIVPVGTRSVVNGDTVTGYDSKVESGITGFDITTGIWTVPTSGYYSLGAKLTTRLRADDLDSNTDALGSSWVTLSPSAGGQGYISIAIILTRIAGGIITTLVVCGNKQILSDNISDVNIEATAVEYPLLAGDSVSVKVLNKTDHAIDGIAPFLTLPDCYVDFSVKQ